MNKPVTIKLRRGERIVAVVPERCAGPGWSNEPTWVYIETPMKELRTVCIQPDERTAALNTLFNAGEAMCSALVAAVPVKKVRR